MIALADESLLASEQAEADEEAAARAEEEAAAPPAEEHVAPVEPTTVDEPAPAAATAPTAEPAAPAAAAAVGAGAHVAELDMSRAVVVVPAHDPEENAELTRRLSRLAMRIDIMAGLVENLFDRLAPVAEQEPLTTERVADISARMVQLLEQRLEVHGERIEQHIRGVAAMIPTEIALDPASKAHLGHLEDQIMELARSVLDVKQQVAAITPADLDLSPVTTQLEDRFEQADARLATDLEYLRRDMRRNDQMLLEMQSRLAEMPDRQSLRELYTGLAQAIDHAAHDGSLSEVSDAIAALPERIALQQPVDRLDAAIIQQIDARLEASAEQMAQKLEEQLAARVQRFEALSQSMMKLAGEPVEALAEKLTQLSKLTDPADKLGEEIAALRREGREREALLRHLLDSMSTGAENAARAKSSDRD